LWAALDIFAMMISENPNTQNLFENEKISSAWVEVILPLALPTTYTYSVPETLLTKIKT